MSVVIKSIALDFPNGIAESQLHAEIQANPQIGTQLLSVSVDGDVVTITFISAVSATELVVLDTVIAEHVPRSIRAITQVSFGDEQTVSSDSYTRVYSWIYGGVNTQGILDNILFHAKTDDPANTYSVRLQDVTNGETIVTEQFDNDEYEEQANEMSNILNLPTEPAEFELQIKRDGGSGTITIKNFYASAIAAAAETGDGGGTVDPGDGGSILTGNPTDGSFGTVNPASLDPLDTIADSFDNISLLLECLLPDPPPNLDTLTISLSDTLYSAIKSNATDTVVTNAQNNSSNKPIINEVGPFAEAKTGTLSAIVKNSAAAASTQGSRVLTTSSDVGVYNNFLEITDDSNFDSGGCFNGLKATIGGPNVSGTFPPSYDDEYTMKLNHTSNGDTNTISFYQDDSYTNTPSAGTQSVTTVPATTTHVSGVPVHDVGDTFGVTFTATNCVKKFYHITSVAFTIQGILTSVGALPTGADRNEGSNPVFVLSPTVRSGQYNENFTVGCRCRNAAGTQSSIVQASFSGKQMRVDTVSVAVGESSHRLKSATGQFPTTHGSAFDITELLTAVNNEELQLLNGKYQYPPAVDYSGTVYEPSGGPDYTSISGGSYSNYRWVTFQPISLSAKVSVTVTVNGASGWGSDPLVSDLQFNVKVEGGSGTFWVLGNSAYPGVGNPGTSADGDPGLVISQSTATSRVITFGNATRTGTLTVRIGFPSGDSKKFSSISVTAV